MLITHSERNAKRHSLSCHKVFQTFNIEREIEIKIKGKRKQPQLHLSCALSLLYMASSIDVKKQTPHLIFKQYEWERKRGQGGPLSLSLLFLTRGPSSCCHQIPSSIFTSTTRLRNFLPFFFFILRVCLIFFLLMKYYFYRIAIEF
jgi:hypothetical protein